MEQGRFKKTQSFIIRVGLVLVLIWIIVSLVQLQIEIGQKWDEWDALNAQISTQQRTNEELANANAEDEFYLEQRARNEGYARPGEIIFREVPGK